MSVQVTAVTTPGGWRKHHQRGLSEPTGAVLSAEETAEENHRNNLQTHKKAVAGGRKATLHAHSRQDEK